MSRRNQGVRLLWAIFYKQIWMKLVRRMGKLCQGMDLNIMRRYSSVSCVLHLIDFINFSPYLSAMNQLSLVADLKNLMKLNFPNIFSKSQISLYRYSRLYEYLILQVLQTSMYRRVFLNVLKFLYLLLESYSFRIFDHSLRLNGNRALFQSAPLRLSFGSVRNFDFSWFFQFLKLFIHYNCSIRHSYGTKAVISFNIKLQSMSLSPLLFMNSMIWFLCLLMSTLLLALDECVECRTTMRSY